MKTTLIRISPLTRIHFRFQFFFDECMDIYLSRQVAMRLLEKDIHDKQDTLISLRRQLEDVKKLNLELHNKLQVLQSAT